MTVSLIYFTGKGTPDENWYAARMLAFTKATRLQMTPDGLLKYINMSHEDLQSEMNYMASTIASSWEFVDLIFSVTDITRACAQQMTRTRTASYAMQSQRVTDMSAVTFHVPATMPRERRDQYEVAMQNSILAYKRMLDKGISLEDARGVLPMNVHCNLIAKYNLRAWVDVVRARESLRVQDEYRAVVQEMKRAVLQVWPWAAVFIEPKAAKAVALLEEVAMKLPLELRLQLAKAADLIKKETA